MNIKKQLVGIALAGMISIGAKAQTGSVHIDTAGKVIIGPKPKTDTLLVVLYDVSDTAKVNIVYFSGPKKVKVQPGYVIQRGFKFIDGNKRLQWADNNIQVTFLDNRRRRIASEKVIDVKPLSK